MESKREFKHIAKLIRKARVQSGISQVKLSKKMGFKNGQFVSNIERSKCSLPVRKIGDVTSTLKIDKKEIIDAMVKDYRATLENH